MDKVKQFEDLIAKVIADPELQKQCQEALNADKGNELLKELGYSFTVEDLALYLEEKNEDMSAEELEKVAGGRASGREVSRNITDIVVFVIGMLCWQTTN